MKSFFNSVLNNTREKWTPITTTSSFINTGRITPNEFVEAGDYLVGKWPFWSWSGSKGVKEYKNFLPDDKQYLVTRGIMLCPDKEGIAEMVAHEESEWTDMHIPKEKSQQYVDNFTRHAGYEYDSVFQDVVNDDDIAMAEEEMGIVEDDDPYRFDKVVVIDPMMNRRVYDLHITYDKYYATPRLWIIGYTLGDLPLTYEQVFKDISPDHSNSTVTVEVHPFLNKKALCVHPCKHANMFKKLCDKTGNYNVERVLELFLRIMTTILPTVDFVGHGMS